VRRASICYFPKMNLRLGQTSYAEDAPAVASVENGVDINHVGANSPMELIKVYI
jgi:hypothetical protein